MNIKCIIHSGYGMYGYGVNEKTYQYIVKKYGKNIANDLLEVESETKKIKVYKLKNNDDDSRFNPILIDAFENGDDSFDSKYRVVEGEFMIDSYDGYERNAKLVFY